MSHPFDLTRVVPILTVERAEDSVPVAEALAEGGLTTVEVTLRTPQSLATIETIARRVPALTVGAATVLRSSDVTAARRAGAQFLVSPGLSPDVAAAANAAGLPYMPGVATPTEILNAWELNFSILTLFPARQLGGPAYLQALAAVYRGVRFCPVADITEDELPAYLALANVLAVGVSFVAPPEAIAERDWAGITRRARRVAALGR